METAFQIAIYTIVLIATFSITAKTGHHPALSLLILIPFVNIIYLLYMAFHTWPIEQEVGRLNVKIDHLRKKK